jgi:elongator complex protein 3
MRALINDFDPFMQTKSRIEQLDTIGHSTDKIDLILMGGTFTSRPYYYQKWFVKRCLDALNKKESSSLETAKKKNESAPSRCIGLTVETRPDWFRLQHADQLLELGVTRIELGIQTVFDDVLYNINRGHTVEDSISATRIAKNSGFKVCYHMMPGLPGTDEKRDIYSFETIFENQDFKPDMIKIYPTLVIKGTKLYDFWKSGDYEPLSNTDATNIIAKIKESVPEWIRIQRIQRDVPAPYITAGVVKSNLRQLTENVLKNHGKTCRCIRCREIGHKSLKEKIEISEDNFGFNICYYDSSDGEEIFISLIDKKNDAIIGYLRLRDISQSHRYELIRVPCMIIRELKVVGRELPIGKRREKSLQHKGFGKELIEEAERICLEEYDKKYLFVLSGIGVKKYYRSLSFRDDGIYLCKIL